MDERAVPVHIVVDEEASDDELESLKSYFAGQDIAATIDASYPADARESVSVGITRHERATEGKYSHNSPSWTILVHASVNDLVTTLGPESLRAALDGLRATRGQQTETSPAGGLLLLVDEETGVRLDIEFQLPVNAFSDLQNMRLSTFSADPLSFHRLSGRDGRWRPPR